MTQTHASNNNLHGFPGVVKGEVSDKKPSLFNPTSKQSKEVATGAAAIIGTATLIGCSLVNENYEARLRAENEKK